MNWGMELDMRKSFVVLGIEQWTIGVEKRDPYIFCE